jgi:hypothetical protein
MNPGRIKIVTLALATPLALGAVGCKNDNSSSGSAPLSAPSPEEVRSIDLPPHAKEVAHGSGELSYKAEQDGAVYLSDESLKRIMMRKRLRAGQKFEFSTSTGQAKIDSQPVFQLGRSSGHKYKLYFENEV